MNGRQLKVFLSCAATDRAVARQLYRRLHETGWIDPWMDEENLLPGQDRNLEIDKAVSQADAVILCLSQASVSGAGYVQKEMRRALNLALEKPEGAIFIIPLRLEACEPPYHLHDYTPLDYFPAAEQAAAWRRLLASLKARAAALNLTPAPGELRPPSPEPALGPSLSPPVATRPERAAILFLAAEPTDQARLRLGQELREIQEKLQLARERDRFRLEQRLAVRPVDLSQALLDVQPWIVHFSGHGLSSGELCFESQTGEMFPIKPEALAALFEQFTGQVACVLLNACYSEIQAEAIGAHIPYVIGMRHEIGDEAALAFTVGFYQALGAGRTIEEAYKLGCVQIRLYGIDEYLTPVLLKK